MTEPRETILDEAKRLVCGDRNNQYGPPTQDFERAAGVMQALGYRGPGGRDMAAHDVAILVSCVKLSRIMWSPNKQDHWVDLAGYAACGWECAEEERLQEVWLLTPDQEEQVLEAYQAHLYSEHCECKGCNH